MIPGNFSLNSEDDGRFCEILIKLMIRQTHEALRVVYHDVRTVWYSLGFGRTSSWQVPLQQDVYGNVPVNL